MIPLELEDNVPSQDPQKQLDTTSPVTPPEEPKKSLVDFARLIKDKYPTAYDDMPDEELAKSVLKKYPQYGDMVDLSGLVGDITQKVSPNLIPMSRFEKQFHESLQPTEGLVQRGVSPFLREAGDFNIPITAFKDLDAKKANDLEFADAVTRQTWGGLSLSEVQDLFHNAGLPISDLDFEKKVGATARQHVLYANSQKPGTVTGIPVAQKYSTVLLRNALSEGGIPAFNAMAKSLLDEDAKVAQSIHQITPDERDKIMATRRAVSLKLGVAEAAVAQNQFWTNLLSAFIPSSNPTGVTSEAVQKMNLLPGTETAKEQLSRVSPFMHEFLKDQSVGQAVIQILPNGLTSLARTFALAEAGALTAQANNVNTVVGSILGMTADTGIQNLNQPLSVQAEHQLINLALLGTGVAAGSARAALASRGKFVPNVVYIPAEATLMGLSGAGASMIMSPESTWQQHLANGLFGAAISAGLGAGNVIARRRAVAQTAGQMAKQPLQLTAGAGDLRLPETFPIYEGKYADSYTVNLGHPGMEPIEIPYRSGEQIPLFDAVIGGQKARTQIGKSLIGLPAEELKQAYLEAGGMEQNLPDSPAELISAIMDLQSSKFPLLEATAENKAQLMEQWLDITREDKAFATPFEYGKPYRLLEEAPNYYKVQDTERPTSIFRIGRYSPGGLTAEIESVTSTTGRTLQRNFRIPDFEGGQATTQPMLFPEPESGARSQQPSTTTTTDRSGAVARLRMLEEFKNSPEFVKSSSAARKLLDAEISDLTRQISTPTERNQLFVSREGATQHLENLKNFSKTEDFSQLDPQYQELIKREVSDLDFLLNKNKGEEADVARQTAIYSSGPQEVNSKLNLRDRAVNQAEPSKQKLLPPGQYELPATLDKIPLTLAPDFLERSVLNAIKAQEVQSGKFTERQQAPVDPSLRPVPDSPLFRALQTVDGNYLGDLIRSAKIDPTRMNRAQQEQTAYRLLGGEMKAPDAGEPFYISDARTRLATENSPASTNSSSTSLHDQALVYAYDHGYKSGMRFVDFADALMNKFGTDIGLGISDIWEQVSANPRSRDLVDAYSGAAGEGGELLAKLPKYKDPTPVGDAERIALASDANKLLQPTELGERATLPKSEPLADHILYPEDWSKGNNTTPEQIAGIAQEVAARKRIVSQETYNAAKKEIQDSLRTMNAGVSPKQLRAMSVVMAYHVENGIYNFGKAFSEKAIQLFGDVAKSNMYELTEDTFRYLRMYKTSPVLHKLTQLPGGFALGKVLDGLHKVSWSSVDTFRKVFNRGARSPEAREIGDIWSERQANVARNVDAMKAQLRVVHDWAEGFLYYHKQPQHKGGMLNHRNYRQSELNSKDLRLQMNYALDEGNEQQLLSHLNVPSDIKVLISEMRNTLADLRTQIRQVSPNALETVVDNYFPRLWKRPGDTTQGAKTESYTGSPLTGSKNFLKQRTLDSTRYGVEELGWELASENFVDNFIARYTEMQKFLEMNRVLQYMRGKDMEKVVDRAMLKEMEPYWKPLNDATSNIVERVEKGNGDIAFKDTGKVRVYPATVADLINSHLAPSLHQNPSFRSWNSFTNFASQFQLLGYFHLALVTADTVARLPGTGVKGLVDSTQFALHGEFPEALRTFKEGTKQLAMGLAYPVGLTMTLKRGNQMLKEWDNPGSQSPDIQNRVRLALHGGIQARMEGHFQNKAIEGIIKNVQNITELLASTDPTVAKVFGTAKEIAGLNLSGQGPLFQGAAYKLPFAAIETIMRPMLEQFVPRAKLGTEYYLIGYEMARMGPRANAKEVRRTIAKVRDVVDDTLGQLNYGNLHMHKATKEVLMSIVRATGFQIGSERTAYMPVVEGARFVKDVLTPGVRADFTHRMAYIAGLGLGLTALHATAQAIMSAYNTGNPLDVTPKDIVAFRTGRKDQNGDDERWYIPNYFTKEMYPVFSRIAEGRFHKAAETKLEMFGHKLNPGINMGLELFKNQDFYGRYIVDPNSPEPVWSQYGSYALEQLKPFFLRNKEMMEQRGITDPFTKYASFFGPTPAPQYINASTAEDVMMDLLKEHYPKSGKSEAEYLRGVTKRKFMNQWRAAVQSGNEELQDAVGEEIQKALDAGIINIADWKTIQKGVDKQRTQDLFKRLLQQSLRDAMRVYESWMGPEERKLVIRQLASGQRTRINKMALSAEAKEQLLRDLDAILDRDITIQQLLEEPEEEKQTPPIEPQAQP